MPHASSLTPKTPMTPFASLFWKEYRQQKSLVIAIIVICFFLQLGWLLSSNLFDTVFLNFAPFIAIAMFITALFAASSTAIVFCNEHEERTFAALRNQPLAGRTVAAAKIVWCLCAIGIVGIATLILCSGLLQFLLLTSDASDGELVLSVMGVGLIEGFFWGLFWSTRMKSQLYALLATYFSFAFELYFAAWFYESVIGSSNPFVPQIYAEAVPVRLLLILPIAVIGLRDAFRWLRKTETKTQVAARARIFAPSFFDNSPFLSLCWITFFQSRTLLLYILGLQIAIACYVLPYWNFFVGVKGAVEPAGSTFVTVMFIALISAVIFCGDIFWADHKSNGTKQLIHCGVSPVKIWWSRICVFGVVYFLPALVLFLPLVVATVNAINIKISIQNDIRSPLSIVAFVLIYAAMFCIGQFFSLAMRSGIFSIIVTLVMYSVGLYTFFIVNYLLAFPTYWTTIPLLLLLFVASWIHANNLAKSQNTLRAWCRSLVVVLVPLIGLLIFIPFYRVYSVPIIDYGYKLEKDDFHFSQERLERIREAFSSRLQGPQRVQQSVGIQLRPSEKNKTWTVESLKQDIEYLSAPDPQRGKDREEIQLSYEIDYRSLDRSVVDRFIRDNIRRDDLAIWVLFPWERARAKRLLNNEFQRTMKLYDQIDKAVYENQGDISEFLKDHNNTMFPGSYLDKYLRNDPWITLIDMHNNYQLPRMYLYDPSGTFYRENRRRMMLIESALRLWKLEHGDYPDSLDKLVGVYLEKLPRTPFFDDPYIYFGYEPGKEPSITADFLSEIEIPPVHWQLRPTVSYER